MIDIEILQKIGNYIFAACDQNILCQMKNRVLFQILYNRNIQ